MLRIPTCIASATLAGIVAFAAAGSDAPAGTKSSTTKTATPKSASKSSKTASKATTSKSTSTGTAKTTTQTARKQVSSKSASSKQSSSRYRRSTQQQPTSERYKEIQQALADKGYFGGTVDGTWGPESVEALKRFQQEQNLPDDGKIGSLSLIALGLGPNHDRAALVPAEKSTP